MKRHNILILDDIYEGNQLLNDALNAEHAIVWVRDISEATEKLADPNKSFDLIICGIHLENERMFDFLKAIKRTRRTQEIPFICFRSGDSELAKMSDSQIESASRLLGVADYIAMTGPTNDPCSLRTRIQAALRQIPATCRG